MRLIHAWSFAFAALYVVACGGESRQESNRRGGGRSGGAGEDTTTGGTAGDGGTSSLGGGGASGSSGEGGAGDAGSATGGMGPDSGGTSSGEGGAGDAGSATGGTGAASGGNAPMLDDPTPGQTRCGGTLCDSSSEYCCSGMAGSGGGTGFEMCSATFCPFRRECDEPSDCVGGDVCCYSVFMSPPPIMGARCIPAAECMSDYDWLGCATQADCEAQGAPACVSQPCGGGTIQTCGPVRRSSCM